jgi:4-amino-4-deoxy-L-arabinose transferase-like glycosyltransferase
VTLEQDASVKGQGWALFWFVFVLALGLRVVLLGQHAFQMDEACIAGWSRRILHGDLLLTGGLRNDKPPLQMYLGALGLGLFGESESAVRLMDAVLSAAECGLLAWALAPVAGTTAALGAGLLLASSPLHRGYGASGIMDGPLAFFTLLSFVLALRGQLWWAGLTWGLGFCSKQTALFFLPLPVLAVIVSDGLSVRNAKTFAHGATWACLPLILWSLLFSNPRLGAFVGMAANQPDVGFRLAGLADRLRRWMQSSGGLLPFAAPMPWLVWGAAALAPLLWWTAPNRALRAWALALAFPLFGMAVFAAMNMRFFDRYHLPLLWALCALPALLAAQWPPASTPRRAFAGVSLALGLAALLFARVTPLPLDQQGAAGNIYDGYRALLQDAKQLEPQGAILASSQGGLRHMGSWYLSPAWSLVESPEAPPADGRPFYAAERLGTAPPTGWVWKAVKRYDGQGPAPFWVLYKAAHV